MILDRYYNGKLFIFLKEFRKKNVERSVSSCAGIGQVGRRGSAIRVRIGEIQSLRPANHPGSNGLPTFHHDKNVLLGLGRLDPGHLVLPISLSHGLFENPRVRTRSTQEEVSHLTNCRRVNTRLWNDSGRFLSGHDIRAAGSWRLQCIREPTGRPGRRLHSRPCQ